MKRWHWICFLTLLWLALTGSVALTNVVLGITCAVIVVLIGIHEQPKHSQIKINIRYIIPFLLFMLKEMIWANFKVVIDVFNPTPKHYPGIICFIPCCQKDYQRVWLANMISLIPGTLTLDTDKNANYLYIHVMFLNDQQATIQELKNLENQVMRMLP